MVTRLAYIVGFTPLLLDGRTDGSINRGRERDREKEKNREKGKIEKDKDGNRDNNATVDSNKRAELADKSTDKATEGSVATKDTEDEKGEQKITRDGLLLGGKRSSVVDISIKVL